MFLAAAANDGLWFVMFQLLLLLAGAMLLGLLFERLKQSSILGYLLAGTIMGPYAFGLVREDSGLPVVAELGVSLLLFVIGLEFSAKRLLRLGAMAGVGGSLQVVITLAAAAGVALAFGQGVSAAIAVGAVVALSSTACVLRVLMDRAEMDSVHGRASLGVLLLQDVAVVPLLLLVSMLASGGTALGMLAGFGKSVLFIVLLVAAFYGLSNHLLPRMMRALSMARDRELLILMAVILAIGSACAAHAFQLSPALGAFVAGIMLAESPFATQIRADISALRALFITLFFAAVGMLADPFWMGRNLMLVLGVVALIVIGKTIIIALIMKAFRLPVAHAVATGFCLAQVGEFGVVIAGIAQGEELFGPDLFRLLVSATLVTLFLSPFQVRFALPLGRLVERLLGGKTNTAETETNTRPATVVNRVILVGFGPSGQQVAEELRAMDVPALVVDLREPNLDLARSMGMRGVVGDATNLDFLLHHGIEKAEAIVVAIPDHRPALQIVQAVRALAPTINIIVRARYHNFVVDLEEAGATVVVDEEYHIGRRLAAAVRALRPTQE